MSRNCEILTDDDGTVIARVQVARPLTNEEREAMVKVFKAFRDHHLAKTGQAAVTKVIDGHEYCGFHSPGHPLPCGLPPGHDIGHVQGFASWCGEVRRDSKLYVCEYPKGHGGPCSYEAAANPTTAPSTVGPHDAA